MKVAFTGVELPEGKTKYNDPVVAALTDRFDPAKVTPYYFEFLRDAYDEAEAVVIARDRVLDLLVLDMERIETRLLNTDDAGERVVLQGCLEYLEDEKPACDFARDDGTRAALAALNLRSFKPTLVLEDGAPDVTALCPEIMARAGKMFFYTAGKQEVHAWFVAQGATAVDCAERIHTDLARGFIKAELVSVEQMLTAHSMQDARSKGLTELVDRDFVVPANTVLEIRFNV